MELRVVVQFIRSVHHNFSNLTKQPISTTLLPSLILPKSKKNFSFLGQTCLIHIPNFSIILEE
nr:MAG TPA: hypothetical protein [Caudoviricetes sp.]